MNLSDLHIHNNNNNNMSNMHNNNMTNMHNTNMTNMDNTNMTNMDNNTNMTNMDHNNMTNMDHGKEEHGNQHLVHDTSHEMYFRTGDSEYILLQDLHTSSTSGMIGACFAIFAVAVLYEGVKFLREELLKRNLANRKTLYSVKELDKSLDNGERCFEISSRMFSCGHFLQVFLHILQVFISYCLMLVFMTFNVWLGLAVLMGAGVGHFLFGWKRTVAVDINEHCH